MKNKIWNRKNCKLKKVKDIESIETLIDELNNKHYIAIFIKDRSQTVYVYKHLHFDELVGQSTELQFFEDFLKPGDAECMSTTLEEGFTCPLDVLIGGSCCDYPDLIKTENGWKYECDGAKKCTISSYKLINTPTLKDYLEYHIL